MRWTIACCAVLVVACGGDNGTNPKSLTGTYQLQTVDGDPLPAVITNDPANSYTASLTSGSFAINDGATYANRLTLHEVDHGTATDTNILCTGTYTRSGNGLSFTEANGPYCGGTYSGSWDGDHNVTVTYDGGVRAVYHR